MYYLQKNVSIGTYISKLISTIIIIRDIMWIHINRHEYKLIMIYDSVL